MIQVLKDKGCRNIVAVDVDNDKLALAQRMGAARTLNPKNADIPAAVRDSTGGEGPTPLSRSWAMATRC